MQRINNRYRIEEEIKEGGANHVYIVHDEVEEQVLVLKTLHSSRSGQAENFEMEFKILSGIQHPNLETVYDYGRIQEGPSGLKGNLFFTCDYIEGKTWTEFYNGLDTIPEDILWKQTVEICRALQFMHSRNLIHFDVKPDNILISDDSDDNRTNGDLAKEQREAVLHDSGSKAILVDFGLAQKKKTSGGQSIRGTIPYIAPEIIRGDPVDGRVDLYSLGVSLFQILTGKLPFESESSTQILRDHLHKTVPHPTDINENIPESFEHLVFALLSKTPEKRPSSAYRVIQEINRITGNDYEVETEDTLRGYISSSPFVGRSNELDRLKDRWASTRDKEKTPRFTLLSGPSGIGKSRLLKEFTVWAQTKSIPVIHENTPEGMKTSFGLMEKTLEKFIRNVEIQEQLKKIPEGTVRRYASYLQSIVPELKQRYNPDPPPDVDEESETRRLLDMVSDFVLEGIASSGCIFVLDNLQWADEMSLRLLEYISRKTHIDRKKADLFIVGSRRTGEDDEELENILASLEREDILERIEVQPFTEEEILQLSQNMFGQAGKEMGDAFLENEGSGNPLFIEEYIRFCMDEDVLVETEEGWNFKRDRFQKTNLPSQIGSLIDRRLKSVQGIKWKWLVTLVAWGGEINHAMMVELFDDKYLAGRDERIQLEQRGLIRIQTTGRGRVYSFSHDRIFERIRDIVSSSLWREVHRSLLENLESLSRKQGWNWEKYIEKLAIFSLGAGEDKKFVFFGEEAAIHAKNRFSHERALRFYQRLLSCDIPNKKKVRIRLDMAELLGKVGKTEEAIQQYREVAEESILPPKDQIRAYWKLAQRLNDLGKFEDAKTNFQNAVDIGRGQNLEGNPELANEFVRAEIGFALFYDKSLEESKSAVKLLEDTIETCRAFLESPEREKLEYLARKEIHAIQVREEPPEEHLDDLNHILEYFEEEEYPGQAADTACRIGIVLNRQGKLDEALQYYDKGRTLYRNINDRNSEADVLLHISSVYRSQSKLDQALKMCREARQIYQKFGDMRGIMTVNMNMGNIYQYEKLEVQRGIKLFHNTLELAEELDLNHFRFTAFNGLGNSYSSMGKVRMAQDYYKQADHIVEKINHLTNKGIVKHNLGETHLLMNELEEAKKYIGKMEEITNRLNNDFHRVYLFKLKGRLHFYNGNLDKSKEYHQKQINIAQKVGITTAAYHGRSRMIPILSRQGRFQEAVEKMKTFLADVDDLELDPIRTVPYRIACLESILFYAPVEQLFDPDIHSLAEQILQESEQSADESKKLIPNLNLKYCRGLFRFIYRDRDRGEEEIKQVLNTYRDRELYIILEQLKRIFQERKNELSEQRMEENPTRSGVEPFSMKGIDLSAIPGSRMEDLLKTLSEYTAEQDPERLLKLIVDSAVKMTGAKRGFLAVLESSDVFESKELSESGDLQNRLSIRVARNYKGESLENREEEMSRHLMIRAIRAGKPIYLENVQNDEKLSQSQSVQNLQLTSILAAPLRIKTKPVGAIYLDHPGDRNSFEDGSLSLLTLLAGHAAVALENARLHEVAIRDDLTGLASHGYFEQRIKEEISQARRFDKPLSLMFIDLDRLKLINDRMGHMAGDQLIEKTGNFLKDTIRGYDVAARSNPVVGRYGGDEFEVLLPGSNKKATAAVAERIVEHLHSITFDIDGTEIQPGLSIGIASCPEDGTNLKELIKNADRAMQEAKQEEECSYKIFDKDKTRDPSDDRDSSIIMEDDHTKYLTRKNRIIMGTLKRVIESDLPLTRMLEIVLESLSETVHAQRGFVILKKEESLVLRAAYAVEESTDLNDPEIGSSSLSEHLSTSLIQKVLTSRNGILSEDAVTDPELTDHHTVEDLQLRSLLIVPLISDDDSFGVLYLDNPTVKERFDDEDLGLTASIASEISEEIYNSLDDL